MIWHSTLYRHLTLKCFYPLKKIKVRKWKVHVCKNLQWKKKNKKIDRTELNYITIIINKSTVLLRLF